MLISIVCPYCHTTLYVIGKYKHNGHTIYFCPVCKTILDTKKINLLKRLFDTRL